MNMAKTCAATEFGGITISIGFSKLVEAGKITQRPRPSSDIDLF